MADQPKHRAAPSGGWKGKFGPKGRGTAKGPRYGARNRDDGAQRKAGDDVVILYGWHSVSAALANPARRVRKILLTENALRRMQDENVPLPVAPDIVRPSEIDRLLSPDAVHQGFYIEADALDEPTIDTLAPEGVVLVLDQITDPHNVGAILRSACAFGVKAIVTTARHSPEATGVLAKAASGALEYVPFVLVQNLARALTALQERGFQCVGLDSEGAQPIDALTFTAPVALVLGAEGKGLRQLTRETCDVVARLDMPGEIKSLNVSNAAALSLYIVTHQLARRA